MLKYFPNLALRKREGEVSECWNWIPDFCSPHDIKALEYNVEKELSSFFRGTSKRKSCKLSESCTENKIQKEFNYDNIVHVDWNKCPTILKLKEKIEQYIKDELKQEIKFDYILAHNYTDGKAEIGWHADKEALNTIIASFSLFATRDFLINPIGVTDKKTPLKKIALQSGDLLIMKPPKMQRELWHCAPQQSKVKDKRFNLTFRQLDKIES